MRQQNNFPAGPRHDRIARAERTALAVSGTDPAEAMAKGRKYHFFRARMLTFLCMYRQGATITEIARRTGWHRSTVAHAVKAAITQKETDKTFKEDYEHAINLIEQVRIPQTEARTGPAGHKA